MYVFVSFLRCLGIVAGLLLPIGFVMSPAMAATITYNFTGDISGSIPPVIVSGFITVNQTDSNSNSNIGTYNVQDFRVAIGSNFLTMTGTSGVATIMNGTGALGSSQDLFSVVLNGPAVYDFQLIGPNNLFTGDALPNPVPSLSSFSNNRFHLFFSGFQPVDGTLTAMTAVPLPTAMILFGVGLVALIGLGTGGLRNVRTP